MCSMSSIRDSAKDFSFTNYITFFLIKDYFWYKLKIGIIQFGVITKTLKITPNSLQSLSHSAKKKVFGAFTNVTSYETIMRPINAIFLAEVLDKRQNVWN